MSETSAQRLSRLLALVPWLAQHDGVSITEASAHFGVTPAELERDLWLIVCCGLPGHGPEQLIDIQFWDDDGRIHVVDPQTLQRPLRLSPDEAFALLVGLRLLAQVPGTHDRGALATATAKLEAAAGEATHGSEAIVVINSTPDDVRATLDAALAHGRALHIVYAGDTRDAVTDRVVDPRAVLQSGGHAYLDAWCRSAEAQRTFRIDRIVTAQALDEAAQEHAAPLVGDPAPADGVRVRLAFTASGNWFAQALALDEVVLEPDGSGQASLTVADPDWLVRLVLGQAGALRVVDPPDLRRAVADRASRALSHYAE